MAPPIQIRKRLPPRGFKNVLKMCLAGAWILMICRTPADPDLWGHVRVGQALLRSGTLREVAEASLRSGRLGAVDPYSFTSDRPWVNHEWLCEVVMALAFGRADAVGLNLLRLLVVGAALAFAVRVVR